MRVPILEAPRVAQRALPAPYANLDYRSGLLDVAQGTHLLGAGVERLASNLERVQEKADAVNVNDALTQFEHEETSLMVGRTSDVPAGLGDVVLGAELGKEYPAGGVGYLQTKGKQAAALSAPTLEELEKRRRKISEGLVNDRQKALFDEKSRRIWEASRARVEGHAAQQREAAERASLEGRMASTLNWVASNYAGDEAVIAERVRDVTQLARALSVSPEEGEAKARAYEAKVAATRLNQYLALRDWSGAQALYAQTKDALGETAPTYARQIETLRIDEQAQGYASDLVAKARAKNGRVDEEKARDALEKLGLKGPERDETAKRLEHEIHAAESEWKELTASRFSEAFTSFLDNGRRLSRVKSGTKRWLKDNAPDDWYRLEQMERAELDRQRAESERRERLRAGRGDTPEQQLEFTRVLADMQERPAVYAAMSADVFTHSWAPKLSDTMYKTALKYFIETKQGDIVSAADRARFVGEYVNSEPQLRSKKKQDHFKANFGDVVRSFRAKEKRDPSVDELPGLVDQTWQVVERGLIWKTPERVLRSRESFAAPAGAAPAPAPAAAPTATPAEKPAAPAAPVGKRIMGYETSKDGKRRRAVYSDGTRGPTEMVP